MRIKSAFNNLVICIKKLKLNIFYNEGKKNREFNRGPCGDVFCYQNMVGHVSAETYNCLFCQVSHLLLSKFSDNSSNLSTG
jgi:hypothetical protein